jgi:putative acetyltransferase
MSERFRIIRDDLTGTAITELLSFHLQEMHRWSPACKVHAMPVERLREPDVTFFSAWAYSARAGDRLAACGALKELDARRGELKSMRAAPEFRGQGAGQAILVYLIERARERGYQWLGLETGNAEPFIPARKLYEKFGFRECPPLGDYVSDDFSLCMEMQL